MTQPQPEWEPAPLNWRMSANGWIAADATGRIIGKVAKPFTADGYDAVSGGRYIGEYLTEQQAKTAVEASWSIRKVQK